MSERSLVATTRHKKVLVISCAILLMGTVLLLVMPAFRPVRESEPPEFWLHVTGIDIGAKDPHRTLGGFYEPRDGWFIYYKQGFHGQSLYRVRAAEASAVFPKVVERLRQAPPGSLKPDVEPGFREWERSGAALDDAAAFLSHVRTAQLARLKHLRDNEIQSEREFADRWERVKRYHWNGWFEFFFLSFLIVFAAWPWLRRLGPLSWAIHLAALPILFCLPFWAGYCPLTFTSAGPSGGVLYPMLLVHLKGLPLTEFDVDVVRAFPKFLEPLTQDPGPILVISGGRWPSPVAMSVIGVVGGACVYFVARVVRAHSRNSEHSM